MVVLAVRFAVAVTGADVVVVGRMEPLICVVVAERQMGVVYEVEVEKMSAWVLAIESLKADFVCLLR